MVRELYLHNWTETSAVDEIEFWYEQGRITVDEMEWLLDAVILGRGLDAIVKCPRCGTPVHGIGHADGGMTAVRCSTPDCHFVGYVDG